MNGMAMSGWDKRAWEGQKLKSRLNGTDFLTIDEMWELFMKEWTF
jgi:hypothetical protein